MVAKLIIEEGNLKGLVLSLEDGDTWMIGSDPIECQLVIEDPLVSRKHAIARLTPEGFIIQNLSTTEPLQINDEIINDQLYLLKNGDTFKIGHETLRFYENDSNQLIEKEINNEDETDVNKSKLDINKNEPDISESDMNVLNDINQIESDEETPNLSQTTLASPAPLPSTDEGFLDESSSEQTIFGDEDSSHLAPLAEIDFNVIEIGRWLLKVIGGPNNGAEFYMQAGNSYVLGTDPQSCDIVFHDTSVSRQHAKITVTSEDILMIEDLKSRNGVVIDGTPIEGQQEVASNSIIALGTTSFVIYDREGEMQTIISPLLPSIVKVLQQEPPKAETPPAVTSLPTEQSLTESTPSPSAPNPKEVPPSKPARSLGPYIILTAIIGLFSLAAIGTSALFDSEPVIIQTQENASELIQEAIKPFPAIRYTFNKTSGGLLLLGHVTTLPEKHQLLYNLQSLKFIKSIDDTGIVIDEYVWHEVNSILSENPAWKGISIHSPAAGQFILSGYLETHKQADQLSAYMSLNFPYLDLLKKEIVVEEDIINEIDRWLQDAQLFDVVANMNNTGEITLTGTVAPDNLNSTLQVIDKIKHIPGVRIVNNLIRTQTTETGVKNISNDYTITGKSRIGDKYTVVINGRILSEKSDLDGMTITSISSDRILLEKDGNKYRIDY